MPFHQPPSVIRDKGPQLLLQQGYGEHEGTPQQQPQPLQQHVERGERLRRTKQGWEPVRGAARGRKLLQWC